MSSWHFCSWLCSLVSLHLRYLCLSVSLTTRMVRNFRGLKIFMDKPWLNISRLNFYFWGLPRRTCSAYLLTTPICQQSHLTAATTPHTIDHIWRCPAEHLPNALVAEMLGVSNMSTSLESIRIRNLASFCWNLSIEITVFFAAIDVVTAEVAASGGGHSSMHRSQSWDWGHDMWPSKTVSDCVNTQYR